VLRERRKEQLRPLLDRHREHTQIRQQISDLLRDEPRSVPLLSAITGIPAHEILWHVMAMKKYGLVSEGQEQDGYFHYRFEEKTQS
jgi:hypothetical protein